MVGITTPEACEEACTERRGVECRAFEWYPKDPRNLPSGTPCEIHLDTPVQTASECGETGQALEHCCCVKADQGVV